MRSVLFSLLAAAALVLAGCSSAATTPATNSATTDSAASDDTATITTVSGQTIADAMASLKEPHSVEEVDLESAIDLDLANPSATGVTASGNTITITAGGTYRLSGSLTGQIRVSTTDKVALVLAGVDITATTGAAIGIDEADEVTVYLADGTQNTIEDAADNDSGAALDSSADLSITGPGTLTAIGTVNDAISSSDGLVIASGTVIATAADDAIRGKDYLVISGGEVEATATAGHALKSDNEEDADSSYIAVLAGTVTATSGEDGLNSRIILIGDGELTVTAGDDGLHADGTMLIAGGTVTVTESVEGLEAAVMTIVDGQISVLASDDAINISSDASTVSDMQADPDLVYTQDGGTVALVTTAGDGLDSNGYAVLNGGTLTISGPTTSDNGAIDVAGGLEINGGTLFAAGSSGMAESPSSGTQTFVQASVTASAGDTLAVTDSAGTVLAELTIQVAAQNVVASTAEMVEGTAYSVTVNGQSAATATAGQSFAGGGMGGGQGGRGGGQGGPGGGNRP